jgi:pteridine reductase
MTARSASSSRKVAVITGAAQRLGEAIARALHDAGYNIVVHFRQSAGSAARLMDDLNTQRAESVWVIHQDLRLTGELAAMVATAAGRWGRLDVLVNNAALFFPTPSCGVTDEQWDTLMDTNLKAPFFLAQAAYPFLRDYGGCIVNLTDIYGERGLADHSVYCISKAGLSAMTGFLAREFAPQVRVNAVAPGAILWPEREADSERRQRILEQTPLARRGEVRDVAAAVLYFVEQAPFVTGQVLVVDGGRSLVC